MKTPFRLLAAIAVSACICGPTGAAEIKHPVQKMLEYCKNAQSDAQDVTGGICIGSLDLAVDLLGPACAVNREQGRYVVPSADIPDGVSRGAAIQIFVNWAEANPTRWNDPDTVGIIESLQDAFPCKL